MATYRNVIEGLKVLAEVEGENTHGVSAEHDIIYAGSNRQDLTEDQLATLEANYWFWDNIGECWYKHT